MSRNLKLFLLLLCVITCRERTNLFDPGNENFTAPPPFWYAMPTAGWYTQQGYLIGIQLEVNFVDQFSRSLPIENIMYQGISELASAGIAVPLGASSYEVDLISSSIMDVGDYSVEIYFGEIAIGSCLFSVVEDTANRLIVENVSTYDILNIDN